MHRASSIFGSTQILGPIVTAAIRAPKLALAIVLAVLAVLAGILTYTGYLVIGVVADYLGTGRFVAGLLLGILFARLPRIRDGKLQLVGLLPKPVRRPLIVGIIALASVTFVLQGAYGPAAFTGFATAFVLAFPWLRRALFDRIRSSFTTFTGNSPRSAQDDMVIDGEFRETKDDRLIDR